MKSETGIQMRLMRTALVVGLILLIPLCGNFFVNGWNWDLLDFVTMGALLFCTGLAIDFAARKVHNPAYRAIAIATIVLALIAIWTELAVGAVSQLVQFLLPWFIKP